MPDGRRPTFIQQFIQASSGSLSLVDVYAATGAVKINGYSTYVGINMIFTML